jgi:hypothetical protein
MITKMKNLSLINDLICGVSDSIEFLYLIIYKLNNLKIMRFFKTKKLFSFIIFPFSLVN